MKSVLRAWLLLGVTAISSHLMAKPAEVSDKPNDVPASVTEITFNSYGSRMSGLAYLAKGAGPHPTAVILHGYPGNEKNLDVAQAMRSKGWNSVFFHYRGSWGSEGEFSFRNAEQDVQVVLQYLNADKNAKTLRIDTRNISLVGHSMGGHMAISGILDNSSVRCAVAYDNANLGANGKGVFTDQTTVRKLGNYSESFSLVTPEMWLEYSDTLFMLNGWSGEKARKEIEEFGGELDLVNRVESIKGRPVLFIPADTGVVPMALHITPLVEAMRETQNSRVSYKLIEDDHSFSSSRAELIETTASFLNAQCKA